MNSGNESILEALRAGTTGFATAIQALRPELETVARRVLNRARWSPQVAIGVDDIVQEMSIAVWRACDTYDPAKGISLPVWVEVKARHAAKCAVNRAIGRPDSRRSATGVAVFGYDVDRLVEAPGNQEYRVAAQESLTQIRRSLFRKTDIAVFDSMTRGDTETEIAARIWRNPVTKRNWDTLNEASQVVADSKNRFREIAKRLGEMQ